MRDGMKKQGSGRSARSASRPPEKHKGETRRIRDEAGFMVSPRAAAVSREKIRQYADCITSWEDKPSESFPVCETEDSKSMCLVSRFFDAFTDELIPCTGSVGVTYFKWTASINTAVAIRSISTEQEQFYSETKRLLCVSTHPVHDEAVEKLCRACPRSYCGF
jgi:hypothetical protein